MNIKYRSELWKLIQDTPGDVAEIGVAEGRLSREIINWPNRRFKLYLVDRWRSVPTQKGDGGNPQSWHDKNLQDVTKLQEEFPGDVVILRGDSVAQATHVLPGSLALAYLDGDHSYDGVLRDLRAWHPKVAKGGFIALHDYENRNYGVKGAVQTFCLEKQIKINLIPENKPEDAGAWFQC